MNNFFTGFFNRSRTSLRTLWSREDTKESIGFLRSGVQWIIICYGIDKYLFHFSMTYGPSMMPTINEMGDILVVEKLSPRFTWWNPLHRNDIIVADSHYKTNFTICKRIIGLPGDVITPPRWNHSVLVPPDHVWIEGDNPLDSEDSRAYGPIPVGLIRGRVVAKIWPFWEAKWLMNRSEPVFVLTTSPTATAHGDSIVHPVPTNDAIESSLSSSLISSPRPTANTIWRAQMKQDSILVQMIKDDLERRKQQQLLMKEEKRENQRIQELAFETFLQALEREYSVPSYESSNNNNPDSSSSPHTTDNNEVLKIEDNLSEQELTQALTYPLYPMETSVPSFDSSSSSSRLQ